MASLPNCNAKERVSLGPWWEGQKRGVSPEASPRKALGLKGPLPAMLMGGWCSVAFIEHQEARGAGEPRFLIPGLMEVSWAQGWGHRVLSREDTSLSISSEGEAVYTLGEKPPDARTTF